MAIKWDIPKRQFDLKIYYGRDEKDLKINKNTNLNIYSKITFDTSSSVSGGCSELSLKINGLTLAEMQELSTSTNAWSNPIIYNKIELYAGYDNKGLIFVGNITEATPSLNNANYSISIKGLSNFSEMIKTIKSYSFSGDVKVVDICQQFAKDLGFVLFKSEGIDEEIINNYVYMNHSIVDNVRYLAQMTGLEIYLEYNCLIVKRPAKPLKNKKIYKIDKNNLIGTIQPTLTGFECDVRLDPFIMSGIPAKLNNITFDRLNDPMYTIQSYSHHGDTRGNTWKTHLICINQNIYNNTQ